MYELITENTIQNLLNFSQPTLSRSKVTKDYHNSDSDEEFGLILSTRTSVESYVYEPFPMLSKLIEATTGLSVTPFTSSEEFLVASYACGGHFDCHLDAVRVLSS